MGYDVEDRAWQIYTKIHRDNLPVSVYLIKGRFRAKARDTGLTGATVDNLVGVYDTRAEMIHIEDDMMAMAQRELT